MAKLTSKERAALPSSVFAGPGRSYPIPDRGHAIAAESRSTQAVKAGRMSGSEKAHIDRRANAMLGHSNVRNARSHQGKLHSS